MHYYLHADPITADIVAKIEASMKDLNQKQSCIRFIWTQRPLSVRHIVFQMGPRYKLVIIYGQHK